MGKKNFVFRRDMGTLPADLPKIIVVEDLTKPVIYGSMWGEVGRIFKRLEIGEKKFEPVCENPLRWAA